MLAKDVKKFLKVLLQKESKQYIRESYYFFTFFIWCTLYLFLKTVLMATKTLQNEVGQSISYSA